MIENFDVSVVYTRTDGSYVINKGLYHVPNEGEWKELWTEVDAYAKAHPEVVQAEPANTGPTDEEKAAMKLAAQTNLEARLSALEDALVELMGGAE